MEIIDNKAISLRTRYPARITETIEHSAHLGDGHVLVKWTMENAQSLVDLGFKQTPSPISREYNYPGFYKPFAHQRTMAEFTTLNRKCFNFGDMGLGKSSATIWAADYLMTKGLIKRVLVIAPLSILRSAWESDIFQTAIHRTVGIAHGTRDQRIKIINGDCEFVIINHDGIKTVVKELAAARFDLIVVDECTAFKDTGSDRWKALKALVLKETYLWMLTGTPAANNPVDAYGIAKLVNPDGVPRFANSWKDLTMFKISMFTWVPKVNARDLVHKAMQPAIRFDKKDCLDLPPIVYQTREINMTPAQAVYYKRMKSEMLMDAAGQQITAVNAGVLLGKLLQIACIAEDTEVLTASGWKEITRVKPSDMVWDGIEWVNCCGIVYKGYKHVVELDGVEMTPDHKVLTVSGWATAKEIQNGYADGRFDRDKVRIPNSNMSCWKEQQEEHTVENEVRLRYGGSAYRVEFKESEQAVPKIVRVQEEGTDAASSRNALEDGHSFIQQVAKTACAMYVSKRQGLRQLWRARDYFLRTMERFFKLLRGHGTDVQAGTFVGQNRQQQGVFKRELQMEHSYGTREQHEVECLDRYAERKNDSRTSGEGVQPEESNTLQKVQGGGQRLTSPSKTAHVYDVINAGPRNRFTVRGKTGEMFIVHNCGAVYSDDGKVVDFKATTRLNEMLDVINDCPNKVLVFATYKHSFAVISEFLTKHNVKHGIINGSIGKDERNRLIKAFQHEDEIKVLLLQPRAAAHGLTLTRASTTIWFTPVPSLELWNQANARMDRPGQVNSMTVVKLVGSPVEQKIYKVLETRGADQRDLLELYREELKSP